MSFQAKRLRVQLPCDPGGSVIEEGAQQATPLCRIPSSCICTHITPCHYYGTQACQHFITCIIVNSGICQYGSGCGPLASLCAIPSDCGPSGIPVCPGGSREPGPDPGPIVIDAEHLPAL